MTIKEVENLLGIPRASIRFYEKEGLISPVRRENEYRDYREEDVERLRKIVVFRKLGLSLDRISDILDGALDLSRAMQDNISELQKQMSEITGAIEVCREIAGEFNAEKAELSGTRAFDTEKYWNMIFEKESTGSRFFDIAKDSMGYQKNLFVQYWGKMEFSPGLAVDLFDENKKAGNPVFAIFGFAFFCIISGNITKFTHWGPALGMLVSVASYVLFSFGIWLISRYAKSHSLPESKVRTMRRMMVFVVVAGPFLAWLLTKGSLKNYDIPTPEWFTNLSFALLGAFWISYAVSIIMGKQKPSWGHVIFIGIVLSFIIVNYLAGTQSILAVFFIPRSLRGGLVWGTYYLFIAVDLFYLIKNEIKKESDL